MYICIIQIICCANTILLFELFLKTHLISYHLIQINFSTSRVRKVTYKGKHGED